MAYSIANTAQNPRCPVQADPVGALENGEKVKRVSPNEWFRYHNFDRKDEYNVLHHAGALANVYHVDGYNVIERSRLNYIRTHQSELRQTTYNSVMNAPADGGIDIGRVFLYPIEIAIVSPLYF